MGLFDKKKMNGCTFSAQIQNNNKSFSDLVGFGPKRFCDSYET